MLSGSPSRSEAIHTPFYHLLRAYELPDFLFVVVDHLVICNVRVRTVTECFPIYAFTRRDSVRSLMPVCNLPLYYRSRCPLLQLQMNNPLIRNRLHVPSLSVILHLPPELSVSDGVIYHEPWNEPWIE